MSSTVEYCARPLVNTNGTIEYYTLPLADIKQIAKQSGITIDYHPHKVKMTKGDKTIYTSSNRKEMLKTVMEWTD